MAAIRYRRVSPLIWDDDWFIEQNDDTRNLWWLLLTGPQVLPLPGLQLAGPASLAEALRRTPGTVSKLFENLIAAGKIQYDSSKRIIRLPNAPKRNLPDNPNQIVGWFDVWKSLPDSQLKYDHIASLKDAVISVQTERIEPFLNAWGNSFGTVSKQRVGSRELELGAGSGELEWELLAASVASSETGTLPIVKPPVADAPKPTRPKKETVLPEDWKPSEKHIALALSLGVDLTHCYDQFCDRNRATGQTYLNWDAAFNTWLRNEAKWSAKRGNGKANAPVVQRGTWQPDMEANQKKLDLMFASAGKPEDFI